MTHLKINKIETYYLSQWNISFLLIYACMLKYKENKSIYLLIKLTFYSGGSPMIYSAAPRGTCENCCQFREPKDIKFLLYTR